MTSTERDPAYVQWWRLAALLPFSMVPWLATTTPVQLAYPIVAVWLYVAIVLVAVAARVGWRDRAGRLLMGACVVLAAVSAFEVVVAADDDRLPAQGTLMTVAVLAALAAIVALERVPTLPVGLVLLTAVAVLLGPLASAGQQTLARHGEDHQRAVRAVEATTGAVYLPRFAHWSLAEVVVDRAAETLTLRYDGGNGPDALIVESTQAREEDDCDFWDRVDTFYPDCETGLDDSSLDDVTVRRDDGTTLVAGRDAMAAFGRSALQTALEDARRVSAADLLGTSGHDLSFRS